ncbi:Acetyltransferase (isoleucine patch superfamily) [Litoreibacter ascidiaceicola]|uniref:Acetyltransferase (Isoleucine patch superfamily) n=1 Tax=Litoreibacter ascidiaceicola TaxID=1486859 RepID=A0A1M5B8T8_9RHOB|nr:acyltransferase [Litoreibacter ascidiaceicola]SHF38971.1 Acetyltransferase (isoleucine patch superfamily) [Litoreibacter ascidiaceicola]
MASDTALPSACLAHKPPLTSRRRISRFLLSVLDPRAYLHGFKLLNHYNQTHVIPRRSLKMGAGAAISPTCQFANPDRIQLGARAHLGAGCYLWAGPRFGRIEIGDDLLLGPNVIITAANYRFRDGSPVSDQAMDEATVRIANDVWIGAGVIVLPGADIGAGAILAAGSVVRGRVGDGEIFAGVPARKVGQR